MSRLRIDRGFSLVELIIVIIVLGIISAVAISRMLSSDAFNAIIARDQIVSFARSAQQKAIGQIDVLMIIQPVGDQLQLTIEADGDVIETATSDIQDVSLRGDVDVLDSCGSVPGTYPISNAAPMRIEFDSLGDLLEGGVQGSPSFPQEVTTGMRICVNGNPEMSVCLSKAGFAYVGDCDD